MLIRATAGAPALARALARHPRHADAARTVAWLLTVPRGRSLDSFLYLLDQARPKRQRRSVRVAGALEMLAELARAGLITLAEGAHPEPAPVTRVRLNTAELDLPAAPPHRLADLLARGSGPARASALAHQLREGRLIAFVEQPPGQTPAAAGDAATRQEWEAPR